MGIVYKAEDTRLKREVAIKFLPRHIAASDEERARFKIEAQAAAALNHPNIATIHAIEEQDGEMFIVMEYLEGLELREIIAANFTKPLRFSKVIDYANQIASGLQAAHAKGITHRDIKSANIMITESGHIKIMDFGLAKLTGKTQLTKEGSTLGTVAYMSPEQTHGIGVDHRTDIWSLGVVLYEMLTGEQPFKGDHEQAVIFSIMNDDPKPIAEIRADVPPQLVQVAEKAIRKEPSDRYQSDEDLLVDLRRLQRQQDSTSKSILTAPRLAGKRPLHSGYILAALLAVIAIAAALFLLKPKGLPPTSIAVLPFQNSTGDPEVDFLCNGLAEGVINRLSLIPNFKVIARASAFAYRDKAENIQEIGRALDVRSVLLGRLQKRGDELAISAELVDTKDSRQIWGNRYLRPAREILKLEDDLTTSIADQLQLRLTSNIQQRLDKVTMTDPEAYQKYLKGRYLTVGSGKDMQRALTFFREAVDIDPNFSLPYAGIAESLTMQAWLSYTSRDEVLNEARLSLRTAVSLDPDLSEAYKASAMIRFYFDWDWQGAEADFLKAIELKPGDASAYADYSLLLSALKRGEEAREVALKSQQLDPISIGPTHAVGIAYWILSNYEAAAGEFQKTIDLHPGWDWGYTKLSTTKAMAGHDKEALAAAAHVEDLTDGWGSALIQSWLASTYVISGQPKLAQRSLDRILEHAEYEDINSFALAATYAVLQDNQNALKWLEKAVDEKAPSAVYLKAKANSMFRYVASDPRFKAVVRRMKFPE